MPKTPAELEEDVRRAMLLIADLTTRLEAAEIEAADARTEARDARTKAARATAALAHACQQFGYLLNTMVFKLWTAFWLK